MGTTGYILTWSVSRLTGFTGAREAAFAQHNAFARSVEFN